MEQANVPYIIHATDIPIPHFTSIELQTNTFDLNISMNPNSTNMRFTMLVIEHLASAIIYQTMETTQPSHHDEYPILTSIDITQFMQTDLIPIHVTSLNPSNQHRYENNLHAVKNLPCLSPFCQLSPKNLSINILRMFARYYSQQQIAYLFKCFTFEYDIQPCTTSRRTQYSESICICSNPSQDLLSNATSNIINISNTFHLRQCLTHLEPQECLNSIYEDGSLNRCLLNSLLFSRNEDDFFSSDIRHLRANTEPLTIPLIFDPSDPTLFDSDSEHTSTALTSPNPPESGLYLNVQPMIQQAILLPYAALGLCHAYLPMSPAHTNPRINPDPTTFYASTSDYMFYPPMYPSQYTMLALLEDLLHMASNRLVTNVTSSPPRSRPHFIASRRTWRNLRRSFADSSIEHYVQVVRRVLHQSTSSTNFVQLFESTPHHLVFETTTSHFDVHQFPLTNEDMHQLFQVHSLVPDNTLLQRPSPSSAFFESFQIASERAFRTYLLLAPHNVLDMIHTVNYELQTSVYNNAYLRYLSHMITQVTLTHIPEGPEQLEPTALELLPHIEWYADENTITTDLYRSLLIELIYLNTLPPGAFTPAIIVNVSPHAFRAILLGIILIEPALLALLDALRQDIQTLLSDIEPIND